ncbi:MAG: CocE/NonD family hydrolase C-terminal non-catalytic domain-containing protein, partial [Planctomycetota bacterium]|nr:CocE/NonD family hydrolase C-terminal non-catalytic domain-containing protein [Planctomycetota bacterium]
PHLNVEVTLSDGYRTLADVRIPSATPGPCGWPVIVVIHGAGFDKDQLAWDAIRDAKQGFATITYDVRGQGSSMALNDPTIYGRGPLGLRERMDMFEVIELLGAMFPNELDLTRVGVTGKSQGSYLAWCAAAHSGKVPPPNPWRTAPFPTIAAVVTRNNPPDLKSPSYPQGTSVSGKHMKSIYTPNSGTHHEPTFFAYLDALTRAEDYATLNDLPAGADLDVIELLKTSTVPVRTTVAYDDVHYLVNNTTDYWNIILPNTPKLINITTGGHTSPNNDVEEKIRRVRRQQWFHHFLRGVDNGVTDNPEVRMSIRPENPNEYNDPSTHIDFREFDSWPPPTYEYKLWLDSNAKLSENKGGAGFEYLYNHWNIPYTIDDYITELPNPVEIQNYIPKDDASWETGIFTEDRILLGEAQATIWLATLESDFQIHAALYDVSPSGYTTFVCGGSTTVRDNLVYSPQAVPVSIGVYGYTLRTGHKLRLQLENLAWNHPPSGGTGSTLRSLPVFDDFDLKIKYGSNTASTLRLSILPVTQPTLVCSEARIPVNRIQELDFTIHSDGSYSGMNYTILPSVSGTSPGSVWNGINVDLNIDPFTNAVLNNNGLFGLSGMSGQLNQNGWATGTMTFPLPAQMWWFPKELDFVAVIFGSAPGSASDPIVLKRISG